MDAAESSGVEEDLEEATEDVEEAADPLMLAPRVKEVTPLMELT